MVGKATDPVTRPHPNPPQSEEGISRLNAAELLALEKRLVDAKEGSRELDAMLGVALHGFDASWIEAYKRGVYEREDIMPEYTASMDAIWTLVREVGGGHRVCVKIEIDSEALSCAEVSIFDHGDLGSPKRATALKRNPAHAASIALIRAMTTPSPKASEKEGG